MKCQICETVEAEYDIVWYEDKPDLANPNRSPWRVVAVELRDVCLLCAKRELMKEGNLGGKIIKISENPDTDTLIEVINFRGTEIGRAVEKWIEVLK